MVQRRTAVALLASPLLFTGCVGVAEAPVKEPLRTLGPDRHPVVVTGHADWPAG
ncbi:hypothetical protein AB0C13_38510 [Streptomyces sp. NPDC049099]|uniref:hypothetical protein n=1 Tax=Streptomyces sp. NPDC049099 TaxID=3155768 RepID=UPI00342119B1